MTFGQTINAFIEDTCVLMVIAYLLGRGKLLTLLFAEHRSRASEVYLGVVLGLVGMTEVIFPGARAPYLTNTLMVAFATIVGGIRVGMVSAATVTIGAGVLRAQQGVAATLLMLVCCVVSADVVRLLTRGSGNLFRALTAGAAAQVAVVALERLSPASLYRPPLLSHAIATVAANGFGVFLLQLISNEARTRAESEQNRLEAERAQTLLAEAQLVALRARIHPHFLFNALTSIAALCGLSPPKAEKAIVRLSQLMRRALESNPSAPTLLAQEIEFVRGYLEIEQHRLGDRLTVVWSVDPEGFALRVPPFALQTLVENAVSHGIAPKMGAGTIRIVVRHRRNRTLVAVLDSGAGMTRRQRTDALEVHAKREHGLQIVGQQLTLLYGTAARLHLLSRVDEGTIAAFSIPNHPEEVTSEQKGRIRK